MAPPTRSRLHDGRIAGDIPDSELDFARRPRPRWLRPLVLVVLLVALGVVAVAQWRASAPVGPINHSLSFAAVLPTIELNDVGGSWVGVVDQGWRGYADSSHRQPDCAALAEKLALGQGTTLLLLDAEGNNIVECGPGMTATAPPLPGAQ